MGLLSYCTTTRYYGMNRTYCAVPQVFTSLVRMHNTQSGVFAQSIHQCSVRQIARVAFTKWLSNNLSRSQDPPPSKVIPSSSLHSSYRLVFTPRSQRLQTFPEYSKGRQSLWCSMTVFVLLHWVLDNKPNLTAMRRTLLRLYPSSMDNRRTPYNGWSSWTASNAAILSVSRAFCRVVYVVDLLRPTTSVKCFCPWFDLFWNGYLFGRSFLGSSPNIHTTVHFLSWAVCSQGWGLYCYPRRYLWANSKWLPC